jgi:carbamoyl-phosphate synthase large subunit
LKIKEGEPDILDSIKNREVDIVINTPTKANNSHRDGFIIRRTAIEKNIQVITSLDTMKALIFVSKGTDLMKSLDGMEVFDMGGTRINN